MNRNFLGLLHRYFNADQAVPSVRDESTNKLKEENNSTQDLTGT